MILKQLDQAVFLRDYWQKKPCIIRGFIPDFNDLIDENELAGLAMEDDVDSRIVSNNNGQWSVVQGPIEDFEQHCTGSWSLLVQSVDRFIDEIDELSDIVNFIPHWRLDDVMMSYSVAGAGVGPHIDEYDVFIIQGSGSRRWQVGLPDAYETVLPHPLLKQIKGFEPIIDEVLLPGDVVYIPPKHPHNGVALEACMNYSIGFRAPTDIELLTGLIDENAYESKEPQRYTDADSILARGINSMPSAVSSHEIATLKSSLRKLLESKETDRAIMQYLSHQALPDCEPLSEPYSAEEIQDKLRSRAQLNRLAGVKPIYQSEQGDEHFEFFIDGNMFKTCASIRPVIENLLNQRNVDLSQACFDKAVEDPHFVSIVTQLVNSTYWDISDLLS